MTQFRVGSVPYVNAAPLIHDFLSAGEVSPVSVILDVPSRLPERLAAGEVDAILVSSIFALSQPGLRAVAEVGIASEGAVESVRMFSRVPWTEVRTLATDTSSMTSNALAQIILIERFGVHAECIPLPPDLPSMLAQADAAVLIGDVGMMTPVPEGVQALDLGEAWRDLTGLPFVWALWVGQDGLTPDLAATLEAASLSSALGAEVTHTLEELRTMDDPQQRQRIEDQLASEPELVALTEVLGVPVADLTGLRGSLLQRQREILSLIARDVDWPRERLDYYLTHTMTYALDDRFHKALRAFGDRLVHHGLLPQVNVPHWVETAETD